MAKRRRLPEEDLEAAVAEMLASPITRANLNFLKPEFAAETAPKPPVVESIPLGVVEPEPRDPEPRPRGDSPSSLPQAWAAEHLGTVFDARRVRPIERASDALSAVELVVYGLLWNQQPAEGEFRLAQYSLNRIAVDAKVNIKTVRELLPRLVDKGFIEVAAEADARRGIPTTYRVWGEEALLARIRESGRHHVVRTGKGVFFAHPVGQGPSRAIHGKPMGVVRPSVGAVIIPMGVAPKPVERMREICVAEFGVDPGAEAVGELIEECHRRSVESAGSAVGEEDLLFFAASKARVIARASNIRNHFAVLRKALPECFPRSRR